MRHWNNVLIWPSWVLVLQESILFVTPWRRKHWKHSSGRWTRPSAEASSIDPDPVSFLPSEWCFLLCLGTFSDGFWLPPLRAVWDYLTGWTRGKEGGEREEEKAEEGSCSAVTIGLASESIPFVYRPFHSPLPVTSLVSVPLILPDI